jgi:hypothetical protein
MTHKGVTFTEVLTAAVRDMTLHGFDDIARLHEWLRRIRYAAMASAPADNQIDTAVSAAMRAAFTRAVNPKRLEVMQQGLQTFHVNQIKPQLRQELDRRILASANLIKLNRDQAIEKTLQRFSGWATSIPAGGSRVVDKPETKAEIAKPVRGIPFEVRRVNIDQGHKLFAAVNETIATQTGAIAAMWRSHGRHDKHYDARPEHLKRDGQIYAIRNSWAMQRGLVNKGIGYVDEIERVGEMPFCRCWYVYLHNLRDLPESMLTARGKFALNETRVAA